ncbi:unnamed protein product, partial [Musa banksii]
KRGTNTCASSRHVWLDVSGFRTHTVGKTASTDNGRCHGDASALPSVFLASPHF